MTARPETVSEIVPAAGERVHVVESGPACGPRLLLSTGLGGAWFDWDPTARLLAEEHRVIAFDRPGLGLSPAARTAPSLRRDVRILAALAERAGPPVTVLAHSVAGFHAEALARAHPRLLNGLVLVDPSYERAPRSRPRISAALAPVAAAFGAFLGATGLARPLGPAARRLILRYTSDRGDAVPDRTVRRVYGRGTVIGTVLAENLAYREMAADLKALRARRPFPDVPLAVLTALGDFRDTGRAGEWTGGHRALAGMSPRGRQTVLPRTKHMVQLDRPDAVADAVAEVLA
ncbi:alpha/beta hydrolase [Spirillospora sp. NPDC029432]|uniref:alpha/beta fold hydrolase n=1 Tax=Spirillospora sp. NPDC029432 TaxID=3154599 RepID=UPI003456E6A4